MDIDLAYPSPYLRAADLNGAIVSVVIERVVQEPVGRERELKLVLYFAGRKKGLILNKTNARKIADLLGERDSDHWIGHRIGLVSTVVEYQGNITQGIRVTAAPIKAAVTPTTTTAPLPNDEPPHPADEDIGF